MFASGETIRIAEIELPAGQRGVHTEESCPQDKAIAMRHEPGKSCTRRNVIPYDQVGLRSNCACRKESACWARLRGKGTAREIRNRAEVKRQSPAQVDMVGEGQG